MVNVSKITVSEIPIDQFDAANIEKNQVILRWLGQAGFQVDYEGYHLMIDPYLSDYLARKYAGKEFPHIRMMPPPIAYSQIRDLDFLLCTHRHSDHLDPEAVPVILRQNPKCKLIAPMTEREHIMSIGVDINRVILVNVGQTRELVNSIRLEVLPSAHEQLKVDEQGNHSYLGYILRLGQTTIYHSGDCVPYEGLARSLSGKHIDIAFLPVNGRDKFRKNKGVPGNFTFEEAVDLCRQADISMMIGHHFGMFSFNTIDGVLLRQKTKSAVTDGFLCIIPEINKIYHIKPCHESE